MTRRDVAGCAVFRASLPKDERLPEPERVKAARRSASVPQRPVALLLLVVLLFERQDLRADLLRDLPNPEERDDQAGLHRLDVLDRHVDAVLPAEPDPPAVRESLESHAWSPQSGGHLPATWTRMIIAD
jgi:hypothetical protein